MKELDDASDLTLVELWIWSRLLRKKARMETSSIRAIQDVWDAEVCEDQIRQRIPKIDWTRQALIVGTYLLITLSTAFFLNLFFSG